MRGKIYTITVATIMRIHAQARKEIHMDVDDWVEKAL